MVRKDGKRKFAASVTMGVAAGWVVTLITAVIIASMIHAQMIEEETQGLAVWFVLLLGCIVSALTATGKKQEMRLVICLSAGVIYYLSLICVASIIFDGATRGVVPTFFVVVAGSLSVYLMGINRGRRPKYRVPKGHR